MGMATLYVDSLPNEIPTDHVLGLTGVPKGKLKVSCAFVIAKIIINLSCRQITALYSPLVKAQHDETEEDVVFQLSPQDLTNDVMLVDSDPNGQNTPAVPKPAANTSTPLHSLEESRPASQGTVCEPVYARE
jgi:hypothetical protein